MRKNKTHTWRDICIVVGAYCFYIAKVHAIVVFDPTNWIQNNLSAMAAIKNEVNSMQLRVGQLLQLKNEVQNMARYHPYLDEQNLVGLDNELRSLSKVKANQQMLMNSMEQGQNYVNQIQRMIHVSALTPRAWLEREKQLLTQKNKAAQMLLAQGENVLASLDEAYQQRRAVLTEPGLDDGLRATAMKTNLLIGNLTNVLSQQVQYVKSIEDKKNVDQSIQDNLRAARREEARLWVQQRIQKEEAGRAKMWE